MHDLDVAYNDYASVIYGVTNYASSTEWGESVAQQRISEIVRKMKANPCHAIGEQQASAVFLSIIEWSKM